MPSCGRKEKEETIEQMQNYVISWKIFRINIFMFLLINMLDSDKLRKLFNEWYKTLFLIHYIYWYLAANAIHELLNISLIFLIFSHRWYIQCSTISSSVKTSSQSQKKNEEYYLQSSNIKWKMRPQK